MNVYQILLIRIIMILFRKYTYKWCNKNDLKLYNAERNIRGDYIRAIQMPLSYSHPLFNEFTTNWLLLFEIFEIIKTGKELRPLIYTTS